MQRVFGDGEVMRYAFAGVPLSEDEAEGFMRSHFTFGDSLTGIATLTERPAGDVIGFAGLFPCAALGVDDFEIGFVLARRAWGRGIATEIGEAQLAFGFERLNCSRLLGLAEPRNAASIHALKKLGHAISQGCRGAAAPQSQCLSSSKPRNGAPGIRE